MRWAQWARTKALRLLGRSMPFHTLLHHNWNQTSSSSLEILSGSAVRASACKCLHASPTGSWHLVCPPFLQGTVVGTWIQNLGHLCRCLLLVRFSLVELSLSSVISSVQVFLPWALPPATSSPARNSASANSSIKHWCSQL